jgi:hypothetical protein
MKDDSAADGPILDINVGRTDRRATNRHAEAVRGLCDLLLVVGRDRLRQSVSNNLQRDGFGGDAAGGTIVHMSATMLLTKAKPHREICERNSEGAANYFPGGVRDSRVTIRRQHLSQFEQNSAS